MNTFPKTIVTSEPDYLRQKLDALYDTHILNGNVRLRGEFLLRSYLFSII